MSDDIDREIRLLALKNAVTHKGKANPGSLVGAVMGKHADWRGKQKELMERISAIVDDVNSMTAEDQQKEIDSAAPELLEKKERRVGLKPLPDAVQGRVVVRVAPSPSGPLHIGHAYVGSLNAEYARMYDGKLYVRIEDTNPSNLYPPAYDMIPKDMEWLSEGSVVEYPIQSDRLEIYYEYALKLFEAHASYVCTCDAEEAREMIKSGVACPCRDLPLEAQLKRWHKMFSDYQQGEAVVRFKSDLNHKNPAMRDFPLFRINEEEHPRVGRKYRVWPLMNLSVSVDDLEFGVTHTLRGKDHADNAKRQEMIHAALGHGTPVAISVGRINFDGFELSTTKTREKIEQGLYDGWDDIRLATLVSLRRRGIQPAALRRFALEIGVTKNDKTVAIGEFFKTIYSFNKELLDPVADRFFFVKDPVAIQVEGAPDLTVELDFHPDNKKGGRVFSTNQEFFIEREDLESIKDGQLVRLIDCLTFRKEGDRFVFVDTDYLSYKDAKDKGPIIHWLVDDGLVDVQVRLLDNTVICGRAEKYAAGIAVDQVVQFERFGFCRCDAEGSFWFTHR